MNIRKIALDVLNDVANGAYSNLALNEAIKKNKLTRTEDKAFLTQLVYGTIEKQVTLDYIIKQFTKGKRIKPAIKPMLRMGCYQLLYMDGVKDFAACSETVNLCKIKPLKGFINAVLREIARSRERIELPNGNTADELAVQLSVAQELIAYLLKQYSPETVRQIFKAVDYTYALRLCATSEELSETIVQELEADGCCVKQSKYVDKMIITNRLWTHNMKKWFKQGKLTIQGETSVMAALAVQAKPNQCILDVCSAPGGKTMVLAEQMDNKGDIVAQDTHAHRIELVKEQAKRLDITCIKTRVADGTKLHNEFINAFDGVLIDAPCSGLGVTQNKPEIKYRLTVNDIKAIIDVQKALLDTCADYVKVGGTLVYSTCTINQEENEKMVDQFIASHGNFERDALVEYESFNFYNKLGSIQTVPGRDSLDGFYVARLKKLREKGME